MGKGFLGMNINTLTQLEIKPPIVEFEETMTKLTKSKEEVGYIIRNKGEKRFLVLLKVFLESSTTIRLFIDPEEEIYNTDEVYNLFEKFMTTTGNTTNIILTGDDNSRLTKLFYDYADSLRICGKIDNEVFTVIYKLNEGNSINLFMNENNFTFTQYTNNNYRTQAYLINESYNSLYDQLFKNLWFTSL